MNYRFFINRGMWGEVAIHFISSDQDGKRAVAQPVQMKMVAVDEIPVGVVPDPMLSIYQPDAPEALQSLMDQLWQIGVRPSDIGTAGHLAATTKHLEDMRAIAFGQLRQEKP